MRVAAPGARRLPVLLQAQAAECALVCLAMISAYHGGDGDLQSMRRRFGATLRGWSLRRLLEAADALGFAARALRFDSSELAGLTCPVIAHWDFDHFVVLKVVKRRRVTIHNPALGERTLPLVEAARHLSGVAIELTPTASFECRAAAARLQLWDFWRGAPGLTTSLLQLLLLSALLQLFALAAPLYMQIVVDDVLVKHDVDVLTLLALGFTLLALVQIATKALRGWASLYLVNQLSRSVGVRLISHLLRLPLSYFQTRHVGDIASRLRSLQPVQDFLTGGVIAALIDGAMAVTTLIVLLVYSPLLASIVIAAFVSYALARLALFRPLRQRSQEAIVAAARLDSHLLETVRALQSIKLYGRERERGQSWQDLFVASLNAQARSARLNIGYEALNGTLLGLESVLLVFVGAQQVLSGALTIGMLYAVVAYRTHFSNAMNSLVNQAIAYLMLQLHLERIADIASTEPEPGLNPESSFAAPVRGALAIRGLRFGWPDDARPLFDGIDLDVAVGEKLAIVGESGTGKSTLLRLLLGLHQPSGGCVLCDGVPLQRLGLHAWRSGVAALLQDDLLLAGTIRDNISFFDLQCDPARLERAARLAHVYDEVMQLPLRFDSRIGDLATSLSAGQAQRVLLARALYRDAALLLLDEGTSHLDAAMELAVMRDILALPITCIFVTHRHDIAELADRILTLDGVVWGIRAGTRPASVDCAVE
jgi:ATP-binding cassette, subfamily B, bacterial CvaB/MchF/RaxB